MTRDWENWLYKIIVSVYKCILRSTLSSLCTYRPVQPPCTVHFPVRARERRRSVGLCWIACWRAPCNLWHTRQIRRLDGPFITVWRKSQKTRDVKSMLVQCWTSVSDVGPVLNQHWLNVSCLLGGCRMPIIRKCPC